MNKKNTFSYLKEEDIYKLYDIKNNDDFDYILNIDESHGFEILKNYIFVEQLLSVTYFIKDYKEYKINDIEAIMSGFGENFLPNSCSYFINNIDKKERFIIKTFWYLRTFTNNVNMINLINAYLNSDKMDKTKNIKLFLIDDKGYIKPKNPDSILNNKKYKKYIEVIEKFTSNTYVENCDLDEDEEDSILNKYISIKIQDSIRREESNELKYVEINNILNNENMLDVAEKMDNLIKKNTSKSESHYKDTLKKINIFKYDGENIIDSKNKLINLQGLYTHLAGKTGSGKSVEIEILLKILSDNGKRVLVVTPNHGLSFKMKQVCENLEIPNVMLMGRTREEYMNSFFESLYIKSIQNTRIERDHINYANALNFLQKNNNYFKDMENGCLNLSMKEEFSKKMKKDYSESDYFYKDCSKCASIMGCSFMRPYINAFNDNTNVIIAPIQTLCKSNLNYKLDNERRTFLENLLLTVDLVIIDEVDEIQSIIEGVFANETTIYTNDSQLNSSKEEGSIEFYKNELNNLYRYNIANKYPRLYRMLYEVDVLINFIARYYLNGNNFNFIKKQIKIGVSFDEESLVYDYLKKYCYKSKDDSDLLKVKARKFIQILKSKESIDFLNKRVKNIIDKYTENLNEDSIYMITDTEETSVKSYFQKLFDSYNDKFKKEFIKHEIPMVNNIGKSNKKNNEELVKFMVFILFIFKLKLDYNNLIKEAEFKINITKHKNSTTSSIPSLVRNLIDNTICGFTIDEEEIESEKTKNKKVNKKSYGRLKILKYDGIGREVLMNTNKYLSVLHNSQSVPMLISSATSLDTKSSLYTVKHPVNLILQNENQLVKKEELKENLKIFCHIFQLNGEICITSGNFENRRINAENMCVAMKGFLEDTVYQKRSENEGILLVSPSAEMSYIIYDKLSNIFKSSDINIKVLYTNGHKEKFDPSKHVDRNTVELCALKKVDILIAVNQTIARGYNILKNVDGELDKSYFTDIIMFNRFLPSPEDYLTHISFAHAELTNAFKRSKSIDDFGKEYLNTVYSANKSLSYVKFINGFNQLPESLKAMVIGNIYCLLDQIKGRGQRGGSKCRIHLIDANCYPNTAKLEMLGLLSDRTKLASSLFRDLTEEELQYDDCDSMLQGLINILNTDDKLTNLLFDGMKEAFNNHTFIIH